LPSSPEPSNMIRVAEGDKGVPSRRGEEIDAACWPSWDALMFVILEVLRNWKK
jgi:hypothetical protein